MPAELRILWPEPTPADRVPIRRVRERHAPAGVADGRPPRRSWAQLWQHPVGPRLFERLPDDQGPRPNIEATR